MFKKIVISFTAAMMILLSGFTSLPIQSEPAISDEISVNVIEEIQEDKQHVKLDLEINREDIEIISVKLPDETYQTESEYSYIAPCNGVYKFIVRYEKDDDIKDKEVLYYLFSSSAMTDGNEPSGANGFIPIAESNVKNAISLFESTPATGKIYIKYFAENVTVDGKTYGPNSPEQHYIAYMVDADGRSVLCMNPTKDNAPNFSDYNTRVYTSPDQKIDIDGTDHLVGNMPLMWYYAQIASRTDKTAPSGLSFDNWVLISQLMIWDELGFSVDKSQLGYGIQAGIQWVNDKISQHTGWLDPSYDNETYVKVRSPWGAGVATVDGENHQGGYVKEDGTLNNDGFVWEKFDANTTALDFGNPKYLWGSDGASAGLKVNIQEVPVEGGTPDQKQKVIESIEGGQIQVKHADKDLYKAMKTDYLNMSDKISVNYEYGADYIIYKFSKVGNIADGEMVVAPYSVVETQEVGSSYYFSQNPSQTEKQPLMQFAVPFSQAKQLKFTFTVGEYELIPDTPVQPPVNLVVPDLQKVDAEDGFLVQGATFDFYAGETYQIHFQQHKAIVDTPGYCEGTGENQTCYPTTYKWSDWTSGPTITLWSKGTQVHTDTTGVDGKITSLDEIITAYRDKATDIINDQLAKNTPCDKNGIEYQHHENYQDKEADQWKGGKFYAMEPDTSYNQYRDDAIKTGDINYVGYANPTADWEKINFTIAESTEADGGTIIHDNTRQKTRLTVHKIDNESNYLNHNNTHEPQGDGYFTGAVFVVLAREDMILHDGSYAKSPLTGKELVKGEVIDILVLDEHTGVSATTRKFDLGKVAVQEVRLPGIYDYALEMELGADDGLYHIKSDQADQLIADIKDKSSNFYRYDFDKAAELGIEAAGGYWYQNYINEIVNPYNNDFKGGQVVEVDMQYSDQEYAYNDYMPSCYEKEYEGSNVKVNGEIVDHTIPKRAVTPDLKNNVGIVEVNGLDYANSIQKGHFQLQKKISEVPDDNGESSPTQNTNVSDVYFGVYLNSKSNDVQNEPLPDKYFANKRLDGRAYTFDSDGNFYRNKDGLILFEQDGEIVQDLIDWVNPTKIESDKNTVDAHGLSNKPLYMVLKTNELGIAGTNIPESIVYANKGIKDNTGITGSYGAYDYAHPNKLLASGLPLPAGDYTVQELNAYEGYEPVSYQVHISKDTFDINNVITVDGIETGDQVVDTLRKQFYIFDDRLVISTILDELVKQQIQVFKRDQETGKVVAVPNTDFMIWQWNPDFYLKDDNKRYEFVIDELMQDASGNYICKEETPVCTYADGSPIVQNVEKQLLPTYNEASEDEKRSGHFQHWEIYYVEYKQVSDGASGSSTHLEVVRYDETNDYTYTRSDGKIIKAPVGNWVERTYTDTGYAKTNLKVYQTNAEGSFALPADSPLVASKYLLCEINSPYGYVISQKPVEFSVEPYGSIQPNMKPQFIKIMLDQFNMPQKGSINLIKKGEVLTGFEKYESNGYEAWRPVYEVQQVEAVTIFEIYAVEDVIVNDEVKYSAGQLVDTIKTDRHGNGSSKLLYLGKYYAKEVQAPDGYITDGTPIYFELTYQGQNVSVYYVADDQTNVRQNLQIEILKRLSNGNTANDIYFGVYSTQEYKIDSNKRDYDTNDLDYMFNQPVIDTNPEMIITDVVPSFTNADDFEFTDGTITGYIGSATDVVIPNEINGVQVTSIADGAFKSKGLTSAVIPSTIQFIGDEAFADNSLKSVEFFNYQWDMGIMQETILDIVDTWLDYNSVLEKIIVPENRKVDFDLIMDSEADGSMQYIPIQEKRVQEFVDEDFSRPVIDGNESNRLPAGTLLEVIKIKNGHGLSQLDYPEGTFAIIELKVPDHVKIDHTVYEVVFKFDESFGSTQKITVNNGRYIINDVDEPHTPDTPTPSGSKKVTIELEKMFDNEKYPDAYKSVKFGLFNDEHELMYELGIDENGELLKNQFKLKKGTYYLQELVTDSHFELDTNKYYFEVDKGNEKISINNGKPIINKSKKYEILLQKTDDQQKALEGVTFDLLDADGNVLVSAATTNSFGQYLFTGLSAGTYYLHETATVEGYELLEEPVQVVIDGKDQQVFVVVENLKVNIQEPEKPKNPDTGVVVNQGVLVIGMMACGLMIVGLCRKKK